jgi:radical SAM superfamily enzyme YgiQ (UPF0313 family)
MLEPRRLRRSAESVVAEIRHWHHRFRVADFVFYDDALLIDAEDHAMPILEAVIRERLSLRFHTPNALHVRAVTAPVARMMKRAGFETIRLGLETAGAGGKRRDRKTTDDDFHRAVAALKGAGFRADQVGAYLLAGLPGQPLSEVLGAIDAVKAAGIQAIAAYYAPIPGTGLWPEARSASRYDLDKDPVFSNNAVLPCEKNFCWKTISVIKERAAAGRGAAG